MFLDSQDEREAHHALAFCLLVAISLSTAYMLFFSAPYGRHARKGFGFSLPARTAWALMESPSFIVFLTCYYLSPPQSIVANLLSLAFCTHYVNRGVVYPLRMTASDNNVPVVVFLSAFAFCTMNGYLIGREVTYFTEYTEEYSTHPRFLLGMALWVFGFAVNYHSDGILRGLRKPGEVGYKIPYGGMFEYVTGANYFGEIVEWGGFALASGTYASIVFAITTFFVLATRAAHHHAWYLTKFKDYPKDRCRVIPLVY